jgi:acyl carrier protein
MVPAAVVVLGELPLTAGGKVDRRALPVPQYAGEGGGRGPRSPGEQVLCGLFADILGAGEVSIDDSFFDLGGHSLLAARLAEEIERAFAVQIGMREIFDQPTVAGLHACVEGRAQEDPERKAAEG